MMDQPRRTNQQMSQRELSDWIAMLGFRMIRRHWNILTSARNSPMQQEKPTKSASAR